MHKVRPALAGVVLAISSTLFAAPAAAAGSTSAISLMPAATVGNTSVQRCNDVRATATLLAAGGKSGSAACMNRQPKKIDPGTDDATINDGCGGTSTMNRQSSCIVEDGTLVVFTVPEAEIIGVIGFTLWSITSLNYDSLTWSQSFSYRGDWAAGLTWHPAVAGTIIRAVPHCFESCAVTSTSPIIGSARPQNVHSGAATFASPLNGYVWNATSAWRSWFENRDWLNQVTENMYTTAGQHRCDDALSGRPAGCVYPSIWPVHEIGAQRYPTYARHIGLALTYGLPNVLTRTTNEAIKSANYNIACPTGPTYPRPTGMSCDEYPFQSTLEGAASQPYGRTFNIATLPYGPFFFCGVTWLSRRLIGDSGGYSVCMVPSAENSGGGSDLGNFYYQSRVIDGDQFEVHVVS